MFEIVRKIQSRKKRELEEIKSVFGREKERERERKKEKERKEREKREVGRKEGRAGTFKTIFVSQVFLVLFFVVYGAAAKVGERKNFLFSLLFQPRSLRWVSTKQTKVI